MRSVRRTQNQKHRTEGVLSATSKELQNIKEIFSQTYFGNALSNSEDDPLSEDDEYSDGDDDSTTDDSSTESERIGDESDESDNCILEENNFDQIVEIIKSKVVERIRHAHQEDRIRLEQQFLCQCQELTREYKELKEDCEMYNFGLLTDNEIDSSMSCIDEMFESLKENYEQFNLNDNE